MSVYVTVHNEHWIHESVTAALMRMQGDGRYPLRFEFPHFKPYENGLHHSVNQFMGGGFDYWLNIDADNAPMRNPLDLVEMDKDILALPTPIWHYEHKPGERPIAWNGFDWDETVGACREHPRKEGLQRVDAIGTGCFLIARRVFEDPMMRLAPFQRIYNLDGTVEKGNDIAFCEKARERGWEIWAHYGYPCHHFNELDLTEVEQAMKGLWEVAHG